MIVYQAQADEEWTIDKFRSLSFARVSGEVIHGDNLNFFIGTAENCLMVYNNFTFVTYENSGDIYQLEGKNIPIKINGAEVTAEVISVSPFLRELASIDKFITLAPNLFPANSKLA